jgi:hypothetical protein
VIASNADAAREIWLKSGRLPVLAAATAFVSAFAVNLALSRSAVSLRSEQVVVQRAAPAGAAIPVPSGSAPVPQPSLSATKAPQSVLELEPFVIPAVAPIALSVAVPTRKKRSGATDESAKAPAKTKVSKSILRRYGI